MELTVEIKITGKVKGVRDLKDKTTGMLNGKINITLAFEGGKLDFQIEKAKISPNVGDYMNVVYDGSPVMVRQDYGANNTQWKDGFVVGEVLKAEIINKK